VARLAAVLINLTGFPASGRIDVEARLTHCMNVEIRLTHR